MLGVGRLVLPRRVRDSPVATSPGLRRQQQQQQQQQQPEGSMPSAEAPQRSPVRRKRPAVSSARRLFLAPATPEPYEPGSRKRKLPADEAEALPVADQQEQLARLPRFVPDLGAPPEDPTTFFVPKSTMPQPVMPPDNRHQPASSHTSYVAHGAFAALLQHPVAGVDHHAALAQRVAWWRPRELLPPTALPPMSLEPTMRLFGTRLPVIEMGRHLGHLFGLLRRYLDRARAIESELASLPRDSNPSDRAFVSQLAELRR